MLLLSVPFVFGPLRSGGNSARFVVGFLIGVVYLLGKGALADGAQVYDIPAWITAWIPVVVIAGAARTPAGEDPPRVSRFLAHLKGGAKGPAASLLTVRTIAGPVRGGERAGPSKVTAARRTGSRSLATHDA